MVGGHLAGPVSLRGGRIWAGETRGRF
jgi:hypothetical protein